MERPPDDVSLWVLDVVFQKLRKSVSYMPFVVSATVEILFNWVYFRYYSLINTIWLASAI